MLLTPAHDHDVKSQGDAPAEHSDGEGRGAAEERRILEAGHRHDREEGGDRGECERATVLPSFRRVGRRSAIGIATRQ